MSIIAESKSATNNRVSSGGGMGGLRTRLRAIAWVATLALGFGFSGAVQAQTFINNRNQVPLWNQHHDYRGTYQNQQSAIPNPAGGFVTYGNLSGDARVFFSPPNGSLYSVNPGNPRRRFAATDFYDLTMTGNDLAGGGWHCAPAATGMWMEWLRQNPIPRLANRGGEVPSISGFAQDADTNQQKNQVNDGIGRLGTYRGPMIDAADAYVASAYSGLAALFRPVIRFWAYTPNGFKQMIDRNKPPVIFYRNAGGNSGHVVVGVGYDNATNDAIVRDPWDAAERRKGLNTIQDLGGGGGNIPLGNDPPSAQFDADWEARLEVMEIPNRGSAPYPYQYPEASHESALREWLGATVIPDVDPFDPPRDNGDGIQFLSWNPGGTGQLQATISSKAGLVREDDVLPPVLYLSGWIDWNNDGSWDPATEQIIQWSGPADFEGSLVVTFDFAIPPGAVGPFWARFRLDRGENVGPYGAAVFGEMEDYLVKFQGSLDCQSIAACKFTRAEMGCDTNDCPAIKFRLGSAETLHVLANGYDALQCNGNLAYQAEGDLDFPVGGDWIVYTALNFCPAPQYSANWTLGACDPVCGNYGCSNPMPNCDSGDTSLTPALDIQPK